ncbi:MAG: hypothetical protein HY553_11900 [Elusimicrobia bacterium]|nr:hypothetical protein [Elusimicrobiota bacterium]
MTWSLRSHAVWAAALALSSVSPAFAQVKDVPIVGVPVGGAAASGLAPVTQTQAPSGPTLTTPLSLPLSLSARSPAAAIRTQDGASASPVKAAALAGGAPGEAASPIARGTAGEESGRKPDPSQVHAARFPRYLRSFMGSRVPTERETRAVFEMYLEQLGVPTDSQLAEAIEGRLFGEPEPVSPRFAAHAPALRKLAARRGVPVARLEEIIVEHRIDEFLSRNETELLIDAVERQLEKAETQAVVRSYPDNDQGDALRNLAGNIVSPSGKSVEELARAGAFMYVDFYGRSVRSVSTGRDPDVTGVGVVFYATLERGRWKIGVYRQNRRTGNSDSFYQAALRDWLVSGGIPETALDF